MTYSCDLIDMLMRVRADEYRKTSLAHAVFFRFCVVRHGSGCDDPISISGDIYIVRYVCFMNSGYGFLFFVDPIVGRFVYVY